MKPPPQHPMEPGRLLALDRLSVLKHSQDPIFGSLAEVAQLAIGSEMVALSIVGEHEQWFSWARGLGDIESTNRDVSFCGHAILESEPFLIEDAATDERFADNPLVIGAPFIRFYAGAPLVTRDGYTLGTLCILGRQPRRLTAREIAILRALGQVTARALEDRQTEDERDRATAQLRDSEARLRFALDAAGIGDWDMNLQTNVARRSLMHDRCFGYQTPVAQWGYDTFLAHVHPEDRPRVDARFQHALATFGDYDVEFRVTWRDGTAHWLLSKGRFYKDDAGAPYRVAGIQVDITNRVQAEALRAQLEAQLREAQKMHEIGMLAGGVAHDFNNILSIILGNLEFLVGEAGSGPPNTDSLEDIRSAALRGRDIVRQILAFSRRQPSTRTVIDLRSSLATVVRLVSPLLPARIALSWTADAKTPLVGADAGQLQQVLVNLVNNATHAIGAADGTVELHAESFEVTNPAEAPRGLPSGQYARLSVADDGSGMDPETVARIFEPFFTTKPVGEGTGLGLPVVRGIVEAHGGVITVTSRPGQGTRFEIYLPARSQENTASPMEARPAGANRVRSVLYLDDEPLQLRSLKRALSMSGVAVSTFTEPAAAIEAVRSGALVVDVVVCDLNMPAASGLEVARALLEARPQLPVVLVSGFWTDESLAEARAAGVVRTLHKPLELAELTDVLASLLPEARV